MMTSTFQNLNDSIKGLTIGLPKEFFADGLDDGVATAIMAAVKEFEALGADHNTAFDFFAKAFGARA
jgi:Asp-tRNA(Asn)/Glu-tRNA(Gln) amidotransferase A subunit family amidase